MKNIDELEMNSGFDHLQSYLTSKCVDFIKEITTIPILLTGKDKKSLQIIQNALAATLVKVLVYELVSGNKESLKDLHVTDDSYKLLQCYENEKDFFKELIEAQDSGNLDKIIEEIKSQMNGTNFSVDLKKDEDSKIIDMLSKTKGKKPEA